MRRRSEESPRTDGGVHAPSSALSKPEAKQSCEEGTVRRQTADSELREGALTAEARKGRRETAGETRLTAGKDRHHFIAQPVFVLDANGRKLAPCHPARAKELLRNGKADVEETLPFAVRLRRAVPEGHAVKATFKLDSGSKHHGFALVEAGSSHCLLWGQLDLRTDIKERMDWRRICRRNRRNLKTRYRKPRFDNRKRPEGWLPPSLRHRVECAVKLARMTAMFVDLIGIVAETASFDIHRLMNPAVHGVGYQRGHLYRTDLRRYLFLRDKAKCAYCGEGLVPGWQADHVVPKSRGGSDRPHNRVAACGGCNTRKSNLTAEEFGHPEVADLAAARSWAPPAIVTSIKGALVRELSGIAPVVETDGALTAENRKKAKLVKSHAADALCAYERPARIVVPGMELRLVARPCGTRRLVNGPNGGHAVRLPREVKGFRQWDEVRWNGRRCYVKGRRKTGSLLLSDLFGNKVKDGASAKRLKLVRRRRTMQGRYVHAAI